ncbi:MAG TPA: zf-HC2 domain-containing protein [Candidatus Eisenbacteria bacterium]|nr:zf-HC2 domain-containing protein [Candidatus Eisenbacteria bacterium]
MTCREFTDFLADYLDGDLGLAERGAFDAHLARCPDCVRYLRGYAATIRLGKVVCTEEHDAVGDDVPEELVQAILAARARNG